MNGLDWILIILFAVGGFWGYKSGLITGLLTVVALFVASIISGQFSERLVSLISNSVEGEALSTAIAYVVEDGDKVYSEDVLKQMARTFAASAAREGVDGLLKGSTVTGVVVDIYRILPAGGLGMLPGDFDIAFDLLDQRRKINS